MPACLLVLLAYLGAIVSNQEGQRRVGIALLRMVMDSDGPALDDIGGGEELGEDGGTKGISGAASGLRSQISEPALFGAGARV